MDADVIVVGGGVIGTAIAWRAARSGLAVTLIDPGGDDPRTDDKASLVAAGMLGPVSESVFGEQHLLNLNLHAVDRFPSFNRELEEARGKDTGLRTEGTLAVAYDSGDLAALDRLTDFRHSIGLMADRLDAQAVPQARALPRPVHPRRRPRHWRPVRRQPPLPGRPPGGRRGQRRQDARRHRHGGTRRPGAGGGIPATPVNRERRSPRGTSSSPPATPPAPSTACRKRSAPRSARSRARSSACGTRVTSRHSSTHTVRAIVQGHDLYFVPAPGRRARRRRDPRGARRPGRHRRRRARPAPGRHHGGPRGQRADLR